MVERPQTMQAFTWQENLIGVAKFINACLHKTTFDQPGGGWKRCNLIGAWALLMRQYGRVQCLALLSLMSRVFEACDPLTASYGCEIWGHQPFQQQSRILRKTLIINHLRVLKEITGVRGRCIPTSGLHVMVSG